MYNDMVAFAPWLARAVDDLPTNSEKFDRAFTYIEATVSGSPSVHAVFMFTPSQLRKKAGSVRTNDTTTLGKSMLKIIKASYAPGLLDRPGWTLAEWDSKATSRGFRSLVTTDLLIPKRDWREFNVNPVE
jgi:hypothetical protein